MKKYIITVLTLLVLSGCKSFLGGDINTDPNNPTAVPPQFMLANIQISLVDMVGGDFSRFSSLIVQQTEGVARQWSSYNNYSSLVPANLNTTWLNMYTRVLSELVNMKKLAIVNGANHHTAVANILLAYSLMTATDVWNDIPYTEAFEGLKSKAAKFDTQASIYAEIFKILGEGKTLLGGAQGSVKLNVAGEDLFYGGNTAKWIAAANSIEARARLHLGEYTQALAAANNGIGSAADNMKYAYPDNSNAAPWYRFNRDRTGDIEFHPTMRALMTGFKDTERLAMWDKKFLHEKPPHPYFTPTFAVELITYRETEFIKAECLLRTSGAAGSLRTAYLNGIRGSFTHLGKAAAYDAYVAQSNVSPGVITLENIITQKYVALFTQHEVYNDWRRTNIPKLSPTAGSKIPVRWPYGFNETNLNKNTPAANTVDIFNNRVGWDKD